MTIQIAAWIAAALYAAGFAWLAWRVWRLERTERGRGAQIVDTMRHALRRNPNALR